MIPAERISKVEEYYFSAKLKEIALLNSKGENIMNLGIGNPNLPPHESVIEVLCEESKKDDSHGYQSYIGALELREAFANWYKNKFNVLLDPICEILPLLGSKEGILHISMAFLNPGDSVLIPNPGYPTYNSVSKLLDANILEYELVEDNNWYPNFDLLEKQDLSRVKIMWVNYPHMPTGTPATKELFQKIVSFGKKHNILICNDNPYSFINNPHPLSIFAIEGSDEVCLEMNSLSKSQNMAGWRMGMVAGNSFFIECILRVKSNVDSGMFKPVQFAAAKALLLKDDWYNNLNQLYKRRRKKVEEIMTLLSCSYSSHQVGMFLWGKVPQGVDVKSLVDNLLYEAKVFITPGFIFGSQGDSYIRISLSSTDEVIDEALNRIKNYIEKKQQ